LLGDNTANQLECLEGASIKPVEAGGKFQADFDFTMPLLPKGKYSFTAGIANGSQLEHIQLQWLTDALIFESTCTSIAAGLAGVAMHNISFNTISS
jgi:lipopolysaccharide transport system ATP-binding protein